MNDDLRRQFVSLMTKCSKLNTAFPSQSGLQINEMGILHIISDTCKGNCHEGINLDMQSIQSQLHISRPAISYNLNTLEKKEYIVREIDPKDRRRISVHITQEGADAWQISMQQHDEMWNRIVEKFGENDMDQLTQLLSRFLEVVNDVIDEE